MALAVLSVDLVAKMAKFEADLGQAARASEKSAQRMASAIGSVQSAVAALGVGIGVVGFTHMIKGVLESEDALSKMSQKLGISVEGLAGLEHAADLAGVNVESMQKGIKSLSAQMFDAASGLAESKRNFTALGIEIYDTNGALKSSDAVLVEVADKFAKMKDGTAKAALAVKLFGKAGLDMIPMLNGGSAALAELVKEGQRLNPVTAESARLAEEFNDNMRRLSKTSGILGINLVNEALPAITQISVAMAEAAKESGVLKAAWVALGGLGAVLYTDEFLAPIVKAKKEIESLQIQLAKMEGANALGRLFYGPDIDKQIAETKAKLTKAQEELSKLMNAPPPKNGPPKKDFVPVDGSDKGEKISEASRALASYVDGLGKAIDKTQDLTETEKALNFLRSQGAQGQVAQVRELVLGLAAQIDKEKELISYLEMKRAVSIAAGDAVSQENGAYQERLKSLMDATPGANLERQRADMQLLTAEFETGRLSEQSYLEAVSARLDLSAEKLKKTKSAAEELGLTFASAFEDALVGGKDLSGVLKGIEQDVLRIMARKMVTEPLTGAITKMLSFDGGGDTGMGSRSGGLDGKGGFMAMLHPQETVIDHTKGQSAGNTTVLHVNVTPPAGGSRATAMQWGADAGREIQRSLARNG